ncbi:MAG: signal peptidase I [Thermoleophilaceae bacterium]|nr:signal peptidase I [Thermoleophilaceae bacterium]
MPDSAEPSTPGVGRSKNDDDQSSSESLIELVVIVAVAVGLALLIQAFVVKPYRIPSRSMVPTLQVGQRVLANRVDGRFGTPDRGDVVVFRPPAGAADDTCGVKNGEEYLPGKRYVSGDDGALAERMACPLGTPGKYEDTYIKRVIGLPGDRLKIVRGHAYINGKQLIEPYINPAGSCDVPDAVSSDCTYSLDITIPPDSFFMMGDNRDASDDSRYWGPVPKENIIGEAFVTYWPPKRVGLL